MQELSLHILDLMENSVRAGAATISVSVEEDNDAGILTICIEDDGSGFPVTPSEAVHPFFTTKARKQIGLGLSLLEDAAARAGGGLILGSSDLGGAVVTATFELDHVDRAPLGDLAVTFLSMILTHSELEVTCRLRSNGRERRVSVSDTTLELGGPDSDPIVVATVVSQRIRDCVEEIGMTA